MTFGDLLPLLVAMCWGAAYGVAASRRSPRGNRWPPARTAWFMAGLALFAFAYSSVLESGADDPVAHVVQHLLVMMAVAPMVAFAAPVTLLLRTLPDGPRRTIVREFKDPAFTPLSGRWAPWLLAADYYVTMFVYQLTPLRSAAEQHALVHVAVHQYLLLCGLLFWLPIAGVDPVRLRPTQRTKLLMIGAGLPAFALLGAIEVARGDTATGWAYAVVGSILTIAGGLVVAARARRPARTVARGSRLAARAVEARGPAARP